MPCAIFWFGFRLIVALGAAALISASAISGAAATGLGPDQQQAFDVYKELVEIDTTTATGDTAKAAEAMAARLRRGGLCRHRRSRFSRRRRARQPRRAAEGERRAQADPARRPYRRRPGEPRGLVDRSVSS